MNQLFECELDGVTYTWNGKMWYEVEKFMELPERITNRLNVFLKKEDLPAPAEKPAKPKRATASKKK